VVPRVNRADDRRAQHADEDDLQSVKLDGWVIREQFGCCVHLVLISKWQGLRHAVIAHEKQNLRQNRMSVLRKLRINRNSACRTTSDSAMFCSIFLADWLPRPYLAQSLKLQMAGVARSLPLSALRTAAGRLWCHKTSRTFCRDVRDCKVEVEGQKP
jgi:hypothetical protein